MWVAGPFHAGSDSQPRNYRILGKIELGQFVWPFKAN
jgi:hypothetical protein